jgi:DNA polymerase-3 subunit epsilon
MSLAKFVITAVGVKGYPIIKDNRGTILPEIAVAGRSNVGKSSLLNHLFQSQKLVKTSSVPGKTQALNFFTFEERIVFADLPGYGYAEVPLAIKKQWGPMVQQYLANRESLKLILFLIDIRRIPNEEDLQFLDWVVHHRKSMILVLTKVDKLKSVEVKLNTQKILEGLKAANIHYVHYSVTKNRGRKELLAMVKEALKEESVPETHEESNGDIKKQRFVCVDCETTGLDPEQDRVIEVAALCFDVQESYDQMESLINPGCEIPETSIAIHHITFEMVKDQPAVAQILPSLFKLIGTHIIVGHGIQFDIQILMAEAKRHAIPCKIGQNRFLDTLRMARLYGESPVNSLEYLRKHFNIPLEGAHRAMSDVIVNTEVFKQLLKRYKTMDHLFEVLSKPILMDTMPLGKHKGRPMKEVPLTYLQWAAHKDFDQDLLYSIRTELKKRKKGNQFSQVNNPFLNL